MPDATQPQHGEKRANLQGTRFATKGVFRFSVVYFLCALVLNMVVSPFVDQFPGGFLVATVLMTLVFLSALLAIGGRLRTMVGGVLVAPALFGEWVSYLQPDLPFSGIIRGRGVLFIGYVVVGVFSFILGAPPVDFVVFLAWFA